jgi:type IV secretion system protein VirB6
MIAACAPIPGPPSLARDLLASTDCFIATKVEAGYGQLLGPGGGLSTALTIGLTLYVAVYGYRLALGRTTLSLADLVPRFVTIGLMLALVTNWPAYQRVVFNIVFDGPQAIAGLVMPRTGTGSAGNVIVSLQSLFDAITDYAGDAWEQKPPPPKVAAAPPVAPPVATPAPPAAAPGADAAAAAASAAAQPQMAALNPFSMGPAQFVAIVLWLSALIMMASSVGLLLVVRIILAILLLFGPVFIALAVFAPTRGLFEGWLRATVKFALVPLIVLPLSGVLVAILPPFVRDLPPLPIAAFRDTPALAILMIVLVFAVVLAQALSLSGMISGAIRLPRRAAPDASANPAPMGAATAATFAPSRAETIATMAQSTPNGGVGGSSPRSGALVAANLVEAPMVRATPAADYAGRLGQVRETAPSRTSFASDLRPLIK